MHLFVVGLLMLITGITGWLPTYLQLARFSVGY